ncbi:hypothetical protein FJT64_010310 [Amphibalanus amphitrite]|uniref:Uncharacterized protein n=1 Tax=Amphibalanus amphitrite TaxID=1232801 RepID=A0A6A4VJS8_AMPAM|nr:hypothetical protein FJT64_010310 [Amphibalanus amphitrite]
MTVQRCNHVLVGLCRLRNKVPRELRAFLIETLVFPLLRYYGLVGTADVALINQLLTRENAPSALKDLFVYRGQVTSRVSRSSEAPLLQLPRGPSLLGSRKQGPSSRGSSLVNNSQRILRFSSKSDRTWLTSQQMRHHLHL